MEERSDDQTLRPPPRSLHHPSPRQGRQPALFSLTPLSTNSSTSSHNGEDDPDHDEGAPQEPTTPSSHPSTDLSTSSPGMSEQSPTSPKGTNGSATPPHKSRSILNLTSSTLFGIYTKGGYDTNRDEPETPWGTGAQTPSIRSGSSGSFEPHKSNPQVTPELLREKTASILGARDADRRELPLTQRPQDKRPALQSRNSRPGKPPPLARRVFDVFLTAVGLFLLGMGYGMVITHLHDTRNLAPVKVEGINRGSWFYLCSWGSLSVLLGFLLPWIDTQWGRSEHDGTVSPAGEASFKRRSSLDASSHDGKNDIDKLSQTEESPSEQPGAEWNPIVRSVGAFVGIAFAIRRLPWQSTVQVSLTLALVNPVLWYLLDRTKTGFTLSLLTGITGATVMMGVNPEIVPSPRSSSTASTLGRAAQSAAASSHASTIQGSSNGAMSGLGLGSFDTDKYLSMESVGVATWILSVFFCSCVCFGNVGRRIMRGKS